MNNLVKDIDYRFSSDTDPDDDRTLIEIVTGKFKGVKYYYGAIELPTNVDIVEQMAEEAVIKFNFDIEDYSTFNASIEQDPEFHEVTGQIMYNLLSEMINGMDDVT